VHELFHILFQLAIGISRFLPAAPIQICLFHLVCAAALALSARSSADIRPRALARPSAKISNLD
jgi:heme A synthase